MFDIKYLIVIEAIFFIIGFILTLRLKSLKRFINKFRLFYIKIISFGRIKSLEAKCLVSCDEKSVICPYGYLVYKPFCNECPLIALLYCIFYFFITLCIPYGSLFRLYAIVVSVLATFGMGLVLPVIAIYIIMPICYLLTLIVTKIDIKIILSSILLLILLFVVIDIVIYHNLKLYFVVDLSGKNGTTRTMHFRSHIFGSIITFFVIKLFDKYKP